MRKKAILGVLFTLSVFVILSCSNAEKNTNESSTKNIAGQDDGKEHMTFTVAVYQGDKAAADYRTKWLEEKFNVSFDIVSLTWAERTQKPRIWLSTGKVPDVMWSLLELGNITPHEFKEAVEANLLQPIPFEQYPNMQNIFNQMRSIKELDLAIDGEQYYWTSFRSFPKEHYAVNDDIMYSVHTWLYRRDWAEKLGLAKKDNIYTMDEFRNMLKAFIDKDPGNNGKGKTIGATAIGWSFPGFFTKYQGIYYGEYVTHKSSNGTYTWAMELPQMREAIKQGKLLYDVGFWKDQIASANNDGLGKFAAGLAGAFYGNPTPGNSSTISKYIQQKFPNTKTEDIIQPLFIENEEGKIYQSQHPFDYWGGWTLSSKLSPAEVDRWMKIMDYLASDEGQNLILYGIKDQDYKMNGDKIEVLWKKDDKGEYVKPYQSSGSRLLFFPAINEWFEPFLPGNDTLVSGYLNKSKDVLQRQKKGIMLYHDVDMWKINKQMIEESKPLPDIATNTKTFILDLMSNQKYEDFDKLYDEFINKNKADAQKYLDEVNAHIK